MGLSHHEHESKSLWKQTLSYPKAKLNLNFYYLHNNN